MDSDYPASRSTSTTSSLDPYYFGLQSGSESPYPPPLPIAPSLRATPESRPITEPVTPARDPANIDRRGLVGVGELATPRWTRSYSGSEEKISVPEALLENEPYQVVEAADATEDDVPDSPWTIEAVDGESSEKEDVRYHYLLFPNVVNTAPVSRLLRARPSITEESGGEEILYPRKAAAPAPKLPKPTFGASFADEISPQVPELALSESSSPPSAFSLPVRRARKRSSDEFELDQTGSLVSKHVGASGSSKAKEEKPSTRRHRSLNSGSISSSTRESKTRKREGIGLSTGSSMKSAPPAKEKHTRQASASSSSSSHTDVHPRRVHTTDFSHLPPSPSSSSIQQFLRQASSNGPHTPPLNATREPHLSHNSANVAHSLLRGTQEGWSGMDDEATAEALRKLDGLSGRSARTRTSVGSLGRPLSLSRPGSRPGTPAKTGNQWEGVGEGKPNRTANTAKERDLAQRQLLGLGLHPPEDSLLDVEPIGSAISSDEQQPPYPHLVEKTPKKNGTGSARSSFTPKRGSASSTTYGSTPTTSSRDSAQMSAATSATSVSATSLRKARRNSAGSDISSVHSNDATSLKDRVASLAINGDTQDDANVPPVPPLPKDLLSTYRSPPSTAAGVNFPSSAIPEDKDKRISHEHPGNDRLEIPNVNPSLEASPVRRQSQHNSTGYTSSTVNSAPESTPVVHKTPSKKWSFSNALNLMSGSPSSSSHRSSGFPLSPRAVTFGQQIRRSTSKDQALSQSVPPSAPWSPTQPDAMASASSLASLSSIGSVRTPAPVPLPKTPERGAVPSRSGTDSSASTSHTFALAAPQAPLSPSSSVRRGQSKRLTPSSIPFFRRSSSQSMQLPPSSIVTPSSPTLPGNSTIMPTRKQSTSPGFDYNPPSTSAHKKSSMLSLGLPSLLKGSSSRKSLHSDSRESVKDSPRKDSEKARLEKKKEDKERSESRISVLMGRKRGKTVSSTDPRKPKSPVNLPPMQMSALEPATAQRVARLKASSSSMSTPARGTSSRVTAQTMSSMQKQSDASLRSRNQLPTIAGSPSVGNVSKDSKEPASSALTNSILGHPKETPTKIPRISSRTSAAPSPPLKGSLTLSNRRTSMTVNATPTSANPSPTELNEFGVMDSTPGAKTVAGSTTKGIRSSPSTLSASRVPRQLSGNASSTSGILPRKSNRDSISFTGLRKSSTSSVASLSTSVAAAATDASTSHHHHRFSALSPSKGLKLLSPKISLPTARSSNSTSTHNIHQAIASASSSRQSLSTPSPAPSSVDEEELLGDEEMMHYIKRQQAKKIANGATQEELDELLRFPEPLPPGKPSSPSSVIKGSQNQYLSDYERKEILDFPSVYCIGARSKKKMASPDNSSNNYGYDDERGDYQVVNHDHLAYRYEVIDTLGKGSFGQVLHCRDHCSGESVAIKIIRNKKRFHHQALVEIKILDNLRKWDEDEKHHVIKMTEHFYFRNHLCIAMELLSINLYELIKANGFVGFTTALIRRFTSQMLMSLSLMRHHRIVHCDLKPENVLLRHPAKSGIKVIDFGSSCFETEKSENEQEQLSCIMEVLGVPDKDFVNKSSRKKLFFDPSGAPRLVVNSKGRRRRPGSKALAQVLRCNDDDFVDFISKCLVWDPERRIKPAAALRHPFVTGGRRPKVLTSTSKSTMSTPSLSGRRKDTTETPKKSLISAPTPLTARSSRTTGSNAAPPTPSSSSHASTLGTSRSYRASQPQSLSSYHSSRTLNGYAVS
ncbi:CMGC/DYRK/DYRK2 protein kinase [Desarmillaria ectypa]|nr:CMGC/DYRK/DYRK2 protein kinase [Desarmillaria ectypa]